MSTPVSPRAAFGSLNAANADAPSRGTSVAGTRRSMRRPPRVIPIVAVPLLLGVACHGDGASDDESSAPATSSTSSAVTRPDLTVPATTIVPDEAGVLAPQGEARRASTIAARRTSTSRSGCRPAAPASSRTCRSSTRAAEATGSSVSAGASPGCRGSRDARTCAAAPASRRRCYGNRPTSGASTVTHSSSTPSTTSTRNSTTTAPSSSTTRRRSTASRAGRSSRATAAS